jgi:hypothetical protein
VSNFRADCSNCCGLCCIVPAQLSVQGFPADKPANTPCGYLNACNQCSIHERRPEYGYQACAGFDCFGAGQWITQTLFANARWSDSPDIAARMFAAYRFWLPRFEAAALLEAALPHVSADARRLLAARIAALTDAELADTALPTDGGRLRRETLTLIRSLLAVP